MAFPTTTVLDDFSGTLSGWTTGGGVMGDDPLTIDSGRCAGSVADVWNGGYWNGSPGADEENWVVVPVIGGDGEGISLGLRASNLGGGSPSGYLLTFEAHTDADYRYWYLRRQDEGAGTTLTSGVHSWGAGDAWGIAAVGNIITCHHRVGSTWDQVTSYDISGDATKYTAAGKLTLEIAGNVARVDSFAGGTYAPGLSPKAGVGIIGRV